MIVPDFAEADCVGGRQVDDVLAESTPDRKGRGVTGTLIDLEDLKSGIAADDRAELPQFLDYFLLPLGHIRFEI